MDANSRKELIDSLVADANFEATYTTVNQRWMVTKLLSVVESRVAGDAAIKTRTKDVVTRAKTLVKKHRDCGQFKYGAINLIFQTQNDLIVDTGSMFGPAEGDTPGADMPALYRLTIEDKYIIRFDSSPTVHHTNYFRQVETVLSMRVFL